MVRSPCCIASSRDATSGQMPFACERLIIDAQCAGGVIAGEIKKVSAALNVEHQHATTSEAHEGLIQMQQILTG